MNLSGIDDRLTYYNSRTQLWEHLKTRILEAQEKRNIQRDSLLTAEAHSADRELMRETFLKNIGGLPRDGGPLKHTITGEIVEEGFVLHKLLLEPRPGVYATAHLYLPEAEEGTPLPAVLFLCGHSTEGKSVERYQTIARKLVAGGMAVLVLDPTGQGERLNYYHAPTGEIRIRPGTGDHEYNGPQCLLRGQNLIRYMLHDALRAFEFLSSHPRIDPARIGITGSSGGGMQTSLMLMMEPRLAAAAPSTFITSRMAIFDSGYGQDAEQIWPGFSEAGYDHADLLGAFAPKPLLVLAATYDFFPLEGTRECFAKAKSLWKIYDCEGRLQLQEDASVHRYTDTLGDAAVLFFRKALGIHSASVPVPPKILPEAELRVTRTGQVLGDYPEALTIFDENQRAFEQRQIDREAALSYLKRALYSHRSPCDLNLRITRSIPCGDLQADSAFWWSDKGLINSAILLRFRDTLDSELPVTIALWEDGSRALCRHDGWIRREVADGRAVLVLNVSGMGPLEPSPFNSETNPRFYHGSFYRISDDLVSLGDSFTALRSYEVLRCLAVLKEWPGLKADDVRLHLHGPYGIYGALAAAVECELSNTEWEAPLFSYASLLRSRYYNDYDIKSLILPGLLPLADWTDLYPGRIG